MIFVAVSLTPTRILGLTANAFALGSCAAAWVRARQTWRQTRLPAFVAALQATLLLDMAFHGRWLLHDLLAGAAMAHSLYAGRSVPQHFALAILLSTVAAGIGLALWIYRARPGAALAAFAVILSMGCWWVEVISLHAVDTLLYHRLDGVTLVRLAGAAFSVLAGVGILWDAFVIRASTHSRNRPTDASTISLTLRDEEV